MLPLNEISKRYPLCVEEARSTGLTETYHRTRLRTDAFAKLVRGNYSRLQGLLLLLERLGDRVIREGIFS